MADVVTDTSVVKVVLLEEGNYEQTISIDAPVDGITLAQIKNAFAPGISNNLIIGGYGSYVVAVARASVEKKQSIKLESDGIYYTIEPTSISATITKAKTNDNQGNGNNALPQVSVIGAVPTSGQWSVSSSLFTPNTQLQNTLILDFAYDATRSDTLITISPRIVARRISSSTSELTGTSSGYMYFNDLNNGHVTQIPITLEIDIPAIT